MVNNMSIIINYSKIIYPQSTVIKLTKAYQNIGKNELYLYNTKCEIDKIREYTIKLDSYYLYKFSNSVVTDARQRLIILKNSNPRTKDEYVLSNMKYILASLFQKSELKLLDFDEILNITNHIFDDNTKFGVFLNRSTNSIIEKKSSYNNIVDVFKRVDNQYDRLTLAILLFIDFHNLAPLTSHNDVIEIVLLYYMLLFSDVKSLYFSSFIKHLYHQREKFYSLVKETEKNWAEGLSNTTLLVDFILDLINKNYEETQIVVKNRIEDLKNLKHDNIEITIKNFKSKFTKENIRNYHPFVSDSTINRALKKLRDENLIKPLTTGRSAYWVRVNKELI